MPLEFHSFDERDFLTSKGWTRIRMHSSKKTDMWTHPVHSVRQRPLVIPRESRDEKATNLADKLREDGVDFDAPGFVHLTREQALRTEGLNRADVIRKF